MHLILASASPRRAELLTAAGYVFEVLAADVDESIGPGESASEYVGRLAAEKSKVVLERMRNGQAVRDRQEGQDGRDGREPSDPDDVIVIAADTAVVIDEEILGKPKDDADAERMLRLLSGRTHAVLTAVSVRSVREETTWVESTRVMMVTLSDDQIDWYVKSGEGRDKAGAYAIQGLASRFVDRIEGSYSNVVGLPIAAVHRLISTLDSRAGVLASGG